MVAIFVHLLLFACLRRLNTLLPRFLTLTVLRSTDLLDGGAIVPPWILSPAV